MDDDPTLEDWIAELRSGKYAQGKSSLYDLDRDTYCCLGVLGSLCGLLKDQMEQEAYLYDSIWGRLIRKWDISRELYQDHLASMNDDGHSFEEIADYLEELPRCQS